MPKFRIDTRTSPRDWTPGDVLFHDDTPPETIHQLAEDYQQRLERDNCPFSNIRIVRVHVITREIVEVVEVLGDDPAPASA